VILPVLIVFGTIFFVLLERPCMDKQWPHKLIAFLLPKSSVLLEPQAEGDA
jgi:hypothetical protein